MTYKELNKVVCGKVKPDELVEIFRSGIDDFSALGNLISFSGELLCYMNVNDFFVDGYKIVRIRDITDVVTLDKNDSLNFLNMIYNSEKLFHEKNCDIDIKSWNIVFYQLLTQNIPVTVECTFDEAIEYYLGWVTSLDDNIAVMKCFDGSGNLFKDEIKINLNFVTQVTFKDKYTSLMSKYVSK